MLKQVTIRTHHEVGSLWQCVHCGSDNFDGCKVCNFCDGERDSGLITWARSNRPWEIKNGNEFSVPADVMANLSKSLTAIPTPQLKSTKVQHRRVQDSKRIGKSHPAPPRFCTTLPPFVTSRWMACA